MDTPNDIVKGLKSGGDDYFKNLFTWKNYWLEPKPPCGEARLV